MTTRRPAIDAHAHVFERGLTLASDRRYTPDYDAPLNLYLRQLDRNGLTHGVLVQPSFLGTDNSYLVASLRSAEGRLRGVAVVDPSISRDDLNALDDAGIVGIRLNLVGRPQPDLRTREWNMLVERIGSLGWHLEVQQNASALANVVLPLLKSGIPIVIDHFGLPDPQAGASDPGFREISAFGRSPNVWMKISAPYRSGASGDLLALQLYPHLRAAFGLDRLMWGSDWPHTRFEGTQTYEKSVRFLDKLVESDGEKATLRASSRDLFKF